MNILIEGAPERYQVYLPELSHSTGFRSPSAHSAAPIGNGSPSAQMQRFFWRMRSAR